MLDDYGALGTSQLHSPRISGKNRSSCLKSSYRAVSEFQGSRERVFRFNLVKGSLTHRLNRRYIPAEPKQEIDGVNGLVDESPTAIQTDAPSPARVRVIAVGPEPFHACVRQNQLPQDPFFNPFLDLHQVGFETILKKDTQLDACFGCCSNQGVRAGRAYVQRLFCQHMQSAAGGSNSLLCM